MTPLLEGIQTAEDRYEVHARPDRGLPVTLYVVPTATKERYQRDAYGRYRLVRPEPKYQVKRSPDSAGLISQHRTFEAAAKSATLRAKRYVSLCHKKAVK